MTVAARFSAASQTGRVGELFTTYELERRGIQTVAVDREEVDLWVRTPSGRMLMVQVKTCTSPKRDRSRPLRYRFATGLSCSADLYALVALDREVVVFFPCTEASLQWFHPEFFTQEAMEASIREHLA